MTRAEYLAKAEEQLRIAEVEQLSGKTAAAKVAVDAANAYIALADRAES